MDEVTLAKLTTSITASIESSLLSRFEQKLNNLQQELEKITNGQQEFEKKITNGQQEFEKKITNGQQELEKKITKLEKKITNVQDTLGSVEQKVGATFELAARRVIARSAKLCAERFEVFDLMGAVRLSLPKEKVIGETASHEFSDTGGIQTQRARKVASYIYQHDLRLELQAKLSEAAAFPLYQSLVAIASASINQWAHAEIENKKQAGATKKNQEYLAHTTELGVMLLTSHLIKKCSPSASIPPFFRSLEIDCRGAVRVMSMMPSSSESSYSALIIYEVGEIKCSDQPDTIKHGVFQLYLRMAFLATIGSILIRHAKCHCTGYLYLPKVPSSYTLPTFDEFIEKPKNLEWNIVLREL